jgi:hypothetical protein
MWEARHTALRGFRTLEAVDLLQLGRCTRELYQTIDRLSAVLSGLAGACRRFGRLRAWSSGDEQLYEHRDWHAPYRGLVVLGVRGAAARESGPISMLFVDAAYRISLNSH